MWKVASKVGARFYCHLSVLGTTTLLLPGWEGGLAFCYYKREGKSSCRFSSKKVKAISLDRRNGFGIQNFQLQGFKPDTNNSKRRGSAFSIASVTTGKRRNQLLITTSIQVVTPEKDCNS